MTLAPASFDMKRYTTQILPVDRIFCDHEFNCRGRIIRSECTELAESMKDRGLEFPIHVQPYSAQPEKYDYRIVSGHRRYTAAKIIGWTEIPAVVREDLIDEVKAKDANLIENLQRSELNIVQEADALSFYVTKGYSVNEIAHRLNKSNGWVEVRRRLVMLPDFVRREAQKGIVTQNHIHQLWAHRDNPEKISELIRTLKERKEKGERAVVIKEDIKIEDFARVRRPKPHEVQDFMQHLGMMITNKIEEDEYFAHQCLAWVMGNISQAQLWTALKRECTRKGLPFTPPLDVKRIFDRVQKV
jgi:ParB family chromosome partitioning protein